MRIAILSFYSGLVNRGVETYAHELATGLQNIGHEVTVFQSGKPYSGQKYAYKIAYLPSLFLMPPFEGGLPDIIISTNGRAQSISARLWTIRHKKRLIISGQSGLGADDKINLFSFPDCFVALTKYQKDWAAKVNPLVSSVVIPNGVDLSRFTPNGDKLSLSLKTPIVLSVAALEPIKRLDLLIKATARTPYSLLLVGSGSLKDDLFGLAAKHLPGRFEIMSFPHSQMPQVYRSATVFSYPTSPWESFGISMLEAMATNLPVVATNDPIREEIIADAGITCDVTDTEKYAKALTEAVERKWQQLPREWAENYAWSKIAAKYSELFQQMTS